MWDKMRYLLSKCNRWHIVILVVLFQIREGPLTQRGFYCNDPALSHPFTGDTISWKWLMSITSLLPLIVILIVEKIYHNEGKGKAAKKRALQWYKEYLFGLILNLCIVQTLKMLIGSPRPHFFDTCNPEEARTCIESQYVTTYTCQKSHLLNQSDKSFPSGHTSLATHAAVFIVYYLHQRLRSKVAKSSVVTLQVLCVVTAIFCAVSRMLDHRHHWWDVLAGLVLAVPILLYTIFSLCKNFDCLNSTSHSKVIDTALDTTQVKCP